MHSCPPGVLIYSYIPQGFQIVVGPPLFSLPQYVLNPGTAAKLTVVLSPYDGNNLTQLIRNYYSPGSTDLEKIGPFNNIDLIQVNTTGLSITSSSIVQESQNRAVQNLMITASPGADQATYDLGGLDCPGAVLLTVGYLPFWQPVVGSVQLVTLLVSPLLAVVLTFGLVLVERMLARIRSHQKGDRQSAAV